MSAEDIERALKSIRGPVPGLWIPTSYQRTSVSIRPKIFVVLGFRDIYGDPKFIEWVWDMVSKIPYEQAIIELSNINVLLLRYALNTDLNRALTTKYVNPVHMERHKPPSEINPPDSYAVFSRVGVLSALKAVVAASQTRSGVLVFETLGELILAVNDFSTAKFTEGQKVDHLDLALAFMPTWELTNPRDLAYSLGRTVLIIRNYLGGEDSVVKQLRKEICIDPDTLQFDGLSIEDFISIVFGIHAHANSVEAKKLLSGELTCGLDKATFLSQTKLNPAILDQFLSKRSATVDVLRSKITGGPYWTLDDARRQLTSPLYGTDFLPFREYPILDLQNGKYLILDLQFVTELLFTGLYFQIFSALESHKRGHFNSLWGRCFELYGCDLLKYFYPFASNILSTDINYDEGQIDALLDFGNYVVAIEFKFFLMEHYAKFSRDRNKLERLLELKVIENQRGEKKGVRQLVETVSALLHGRVANVPPNRPVFPVMVVSEPSLECPGINTWLNTRFQQLLGSSPDRHLIKPLTVMSIHELEEVLPYFEAGDATWDGILEQRFVGSDEISLISIHQALYNVLRDKRAERRRNRVPLNEFDSIYSEIKKRFGVAE